MGVLSSVLQDANPQSGVQLGGGSVAEDNVGHHPLIKATDASMPPGCYRGKWPSKDTESLPSTRYVLGVNAAGGFTVSRVVKRGMLRQITLPADISCPQVHGRWT